MYGGVFSLIPKRCKWALCRWRAASGIRPGTAVWVMSLVLAALLAGCMRAKPARSVSIPAPDIGQVQSTPFVPSSPVQEIPAVMPTLAPTVTSSPTPAPTETPSSALVPGTEITITVRPKDTLYSLACRFHTTVLAVQGRNGLGQSTAIRIGQTLIIPVGSQPPCRMPRIHIVRRGETLYSIAREYGVSPQALVQVNALTDPNRLFAGQRLVIP
jgi:LysM repeat protein